MRSYANSGREASAGVRGVPGSENAVVLNNGTRRYFSELVRERLFGCREGFDPREVVRKVLSPINRVNFLSSLTNSIERAAMAVADLVRGTWWEVTFESCTHSAADRWWQFSKPSWQGTEPVRFDEASDAPYVFHIPAGDPVELRLGENDCHERRTGRCSLEIEEPADDELGEASWGYCRHLADLASLWLFVKENFPEGHDTLDDDAAAVVAQQYWRPLYGTIDAVEPDTVRKARWLYQDQIEATWTENGCWSFVDSQHRWCASRHAGLDLPIKLHVVRPRLRVSRARHRLTR